MGCYLPGPQPDRAGPVPADPATLGSGGYVWPGIKSLDPLFLKYWSKQGIDMRPFLT